MGMLKWLVLAVVIIAAGLYGLRKYALDHATEEGSFSNRIYDKRIEKELLDMCHATVKKIESRYEETAPAQFASACKCFANDMSEKLKAVPPDETHAFLEQDANRKSAENIIKKCGYAAGLN
jgi:predicted negative regulator of RcsB-dependent stress response